MAREVDTQDQGETSNLLPHEKPEYKRTKAYQERAKANEAFAKEYVETHRPPPRAPGRVKAATAFGAN